MLAENCIVSTIQIRLNGESREMSAEQTLAGVIELLDLSAKRVAIELNGLVIARTKWPETPLNEGDLIEVVHFVGGG